MAKQLIIDCHSLFDIAVEQDFIDYIIRQIEPVPPATCAYIGDVALPES